MASQPTAVTMTLAATRTPHNDNKVNENNIDNNDNDNSRNDYNRNSLTTTGNGDGDSTCNGNGDCKYEQWQ